MSAREQLLRLLQNPRIAKLLDDPRTTQLIMRGLKLRADIDTVVDRRMEKVAHTLHLATKREVRELRRTIRKLEQELAEARQS